MRPSILLLLAGSALLAACASHPEAAVPGPTNPAARTPLDQYTPNLIEGADEILLASTGGLSPTQADALGELVMRWRDDGAESPIVVSSAPSGPAHDTAQAAARALAGYGVPSMALQVATAEPAGPALEPVRVGYARLQAVLPDCAGRWDELTRTSSNNVPAGFGCAIASNMAAQVANPRDLINPRGEAPADGVRRADVLEKYRKGQSTASQRGGDERGVVSNSVQ